MFFRKNRQERQRHLSTLAFVERELGNMLRPFPRARLKVRHEKRQSVFLVHQKREEGEEDLYSFVWMKVIWSKGIVEFSTREMHPRVRTCSTYHVYDAISEMVAFLKKHSTPRTFMLVEGE